MFNVLLVCLIAISIVYGYKNREAANQNKF